MPVLDGVRGLAILLVMQFHLWGLSFSIASDVPTRSVDKWAARVSGMGWSGVDLFFVLSGFLITGILYDTKSSGSYLRTFYARRFLRLAPVYYLFLVFVLFLAPLIEPINAVAQVDELRTVHLWMWFYAINFGEAIKGFDASLPVVHILFWSLAVEEQFYLVWPLVVLALPRRPLMLTCCMMIVGALAIRVALTAGVYDHVFANKATYVLMPSRMDTLALGALIALALRGTEFPLLAQAAPFVAAMAVAFLAILFVKNDGLSPAHTDVSRLGFTAVALFFAAFLILALEASRDSRLTHILSLAPLRAFGKYSYALYVFHLLTAFVLARAFALNELTPKVQGSQIPTNVVFSIVATATTFALAWVSWQLVEQPLLQLKKRLRYGERSSPSGPAAATAEGV